MSSARELLQNGDLGAATEAAIQAVKSAPTDAGARITLFEMLAAAGQWDRASKHLDALSTQVPDMFESITSYMGVLDGERKRSQILVEGKGEPEQVTPKAFDVSSRLEAAHALARGESVEAKRILDQLEDERQETAGSVDGASTEDFRDADDLLSGVLEVIAQGRYGWIPLVEVKKLSIPEPEHFRDLLWSPATVELTDGMSSRMFIPVRYVGSDVSSDSAVQLGRTTTWDDSGDVVRGLGQRAFVACEDLKPLLELREVEFTASSASD